MASALDKRHVFYVSDGTGITAETLGHAVFAQFPSVAFESVVIPYVDSIERAQQAVVMINAAAATSINQPLVIDTLVDQNIRQIINQAQAINLDVFEGVIAKVAQYVEQTPVPLVGTSHGKVDSAGYKSRISAIHFALDNDDGARTRHYDLADVILLGVSRSGKTPTCIYLAMQFGVRAANFPITEEDLDSYQLPAALKPHKNKLFGLMIDAERLVAIRNERKAGSRYASYQQCERELGMVKAIFEKENIRYLDISEMSIEEISTRILQETGLHRRIG